MNAVGILIDLQYLNKMTKKEFYLLDKVARRYSGNNDNELYKVLSDDRYWYFNLTDHTDLNKIYTYYSHFTSVHDCLIKIYEYDIINDKINYNIKDFPVLSLNDKFEVLIRTISIFPNDIIYTPIHKLDFKKEILEDESNDTIELILNDYERILSIIRLFIVFDYKRIKGNDINEDKNT